MVMVLAMVVAVVLVRVTVCSVWTVLLSTW